MKFKRVDLLLIAVAVINSLMWIVFGGIAPHADTDSYILAWDNSISRGFIDCIRTPAYPIIIGIAKTVAGKYYSEAVFIIQHIIFLISVIYFKRLASYMIKSSKAVYIASFLYALLPTEISWSNFILTEPLAMTGCVFLFHSLARFRKERKISSVFWSTFWLLFLIMLRPALIYLIPVCLFAWMLFGLKSKEAQLSE